MKTTEEMLAEVCTTIANMLHPELVPFTSRRRPARG